MTQIKEFNNLDLMQSVRNNHLNPLIRRIENEIVPTITNLENEIHDSYKEVSLDIPTKVMKFDKGPGGYKEIDLNPIMPKAPGIGVLDIRGQGPSTGIDVLHFPDATIDVLSTGKDVSVGFKWPEIFEHNQKWTEAVIDGTVSEMKSVIFLGDKDAVKTDGTNVTLKIPKVEPIMVTIPDGTPAVTTPVEVKSLRVTGNVAGTVIDAQGRLTLDLQAGGGGGGITNQNFKGFFETLGDIQSQVTDPRDGKSFAFAKDSTLGGLYYTPYFYVNGAWKELKQDPALTYSAPSVATNQGVFSIKPSEKITIDSNGQLDLDGLSTPQLPQYFAGFYENLDALKAACPNPVYHQTFAFVKGEGGGWLNYRSDKQGSASMWKVVAPMGSFSFVDGASKSYKQVFGIRKSDSWEVDSDNLLVLKNGGGGGGDGMQVGVSGYDGTLVTHDVKTMTYSKGKSLASFSGTDNSELTIEHPQRVINYNGTWESNHNTQDYTGNIFYDETSRTWMGWGLSKDGGVDQKWTRIAHPHMSDEVKSLDRRFPEKLKPIQPDIIADSPSWAYTGVTYLEKGSIHLPDEIKDICGGYITTSVQDVDAPGVTIPQCRLQSCIADQLDGGQYVRRFVSGGSPGAVTSWSPWVRNSFAVEDIRKHEKDPNAHKDVIKFYAVHALHGKIVDLAQQTMDGIPGVLRAEGNYDVLADSYGHIFLQQDRGSVPYEHWFNAEGVVEFSGYDGNNTYPVGKWTVQLRVKKNGSGVIKNLQKFNYVHMNEKEKYPPIKFKAKRVELARGDELYMHIYFDNTTALINRHPDIYIVPVRSYISYQDSETAAGTLIAANYRKYFGKLDVTGEVAVKVHHRDIHNPQSGIRVYGTKITNNPTDMVEELTP